MKEDVILIHGYRGSPAGLAEIGKVLESAGHRVFIPSIPPFANSKPLEDYTKDSYADFISAYIKSTTPLK